ncbi:hypothetical protein JZU61_04550 [bacterium]|jgi:hypothetical protein|nr:hypothetical protein [bacterium]
MEIATNSGIGMSNGEMVIAILTTIGLILGILKVWIQSQTDIAKVQTQIMNLQERNTDTKNDLEKHKVDDQIRYEQMRRENREDHGKLFDKIDDLKKAL